MVENQEIAKIFHEMAILFEMDDVPFKPQAYERASLNIETLSESLGQIYKNGGIKALENISGIGKAMALHIEEYLKTKKIKHYIKLKKKIPVDLENLLKVEGIGPKTIKELYKKLKVKNLTDLEKVAKAGKIGKLPNFGKKTEENILQGIEFLRRSSGRFLLGEILPYAREIESRLKKLKQVKKISVAGSLRRKKETIGDIDFLITSSNPQPVMDYFVSMPEVVKVWGKGATRSSVRLDAGFDVDLRVVPEKSFGAALQYFTGSKEHNIETRKIAIQKGLKLNEYGIYKGKKLIPCESEEKVYEILGIEMPIPEIRENRGEIALAIKNKLPKVIELKDIKGDFHVHSNWDGGENSIEELVKVAIEKGYKYLGISDHTKFLKIENGLDEKKLLKQNKAIKLINQKLKEEKIDFHLLHGCELNILPDGSPDIDNKVLEKLDYVIAGVHSSMKMPREKMTARIIKAMENKNIDIISHPTGRILKRRDEYEIDLDKIFECAKKTGTILEINSSPSRLDLNDYNIRRAKEMGIKMIINTDTHEKSQLDLMEYGVSQARRGWAEKKDIINCWPYEKLIKAFKK